MNYAYNNNFNNNPYARNYGMPNYTQPQYQVPMQQQPMSQMPNQPTMQQTMPIDTPIQYVGYANSKEAEAHILFPNQKALFIDKANGMVYEKICGIDGQSSIISYKRIENKGENQAVEQQNTQPSIDLSNYVKKDDLGQFASLKQYEELKEMFEKFQKQLTVVRTNVPTTKQQQ